MSKYQVAQNEVKKNKKMLKDYQNTMNYLSDIKEVCMKEDELYKQYMVAKESKLSVIRNEKLVKKILVSDELQKKSIGKLFI